MTMQEMKNKMIKDFGFENKHVINFFNWCEANPNPTNIDLTDAYNTNTHHAVMDILSNSERIF